MTAENPPPDLNWHVLHGPMTPDGLRAALGQIAAAHGLSVTYPHPDTALVFRQDQSVALTVRWHAHRPPLPDTQAHNLEPDRHLEILLDCRADEATRTSLVNDLTLRLRRHSGSELDRIRAHLPLIDRYATSDLGVDGWALIFRDHYVENTLGFLLGIHRAGIPAHRIYALAKGDRTHRRDRVHATLLAHGIASGVLDNTAINAPAGHETELAAARATVDAFIDDAHAVGLRVLVIDDGGLIAQGYGGDDAARRVDAAIELTVSGLKRIGAAGPLAIPVLNLARSELKTRLGYPEIAESCARRLRALLPAHKLSGRRVLVIGFGELGSRLSDSLRGQGAQVHIVDTDPLSLITAAEAGYPTHRRVSDALTAAPPFLVIGTTGSDAITATDLTLIPDEVFLAPFATRDFSLLATPQYDRQATLIPGVGRRYRLDDGRHVTVLGDGRSLNLYEADAIPNQGYDAYRAGTLIAAGWLCRNADQLTPGVHVEIVNDIARGSGLYEAYYDTYLAGPTADTQTGTEVAGTAHGVGGLRACVVGYGVAGRLHAEILAEAGASLTILDPKHQDLPKDFRSFTTGVEELPDAVASAVALWSVCCPTADHLPVLRAILDRDPQARVLLEKPACQGHEIAELTALLASHRNARLVLVDQYRHSRALDALRQIVGELEPEAKINHIGVTFSKDRTVDISRGRFVDRSYGVLGYEWLHMLTALRQFLPVNVWAAYLAGDPHRSELTATYDPRMFVSALTERTTIAAEGHHVSTELASTITGSTVILGSTPRTSPLGHNRWSRGRRPTDDRHRHITVHAGQTRFVAHLDPVTAPDGWQLDRNQHRITAHRGDRLLHDSVIDDSPLHTAVRDAVSRLLSDDPLPPPDLTPLLRIAALAQFLHAQQPNLTLAAS
ncbi:Gfo/Idh/MocA family oxidoreductase [Micromonospora haikouensis]|uniref:Gfo/Idh/MocA family oxidoreductase n=1 Tax=Micromonospora haikouensis TaxID=686309 RepID=UPI00378B986F